MISIIKNIGKGTSYEFSKHVLFTQLPSRNRSNDNAEQLEINGTIKMELVIS